MVMSERTVAAGVLAFVLVLLVGALAHRPAPRRPAVLDGGDGARSGPPRRVDRSWRRPMGVLGGAFLAGAAVAAVGLAPVVVAGIALVALRLRRRRSRQRRPPARRGVRDA